MSQKEVMTCEQVAEVLQIHIQTVYTKIRDREIPAFKIGRHWRVLREDLNEYIKKQKMR